VKVVADTLGVARSNLIQRLKGITKPRQCYHKAQDQEVAPRIVALVSARPTYSYRRITAILNHQLRSEGLAPCSRQRATGTGEQHPLKRLVTQSVMERPRKSGVARPFEHVVDGAARHSECATYIARRCATVVQPQAQSHLSHRQPLNRFHTLDWVTLEQEIITHARGDGPTGALNLTSDQRDMAEIGARRALYMLMPYLDTSQSQHGPTP